MIILELFPIYAKVLEMSQETKQQTWLVTGKNPVLFQIPMLATDSGSKVELRPAVPLLKIQTAALAAVLMDKSLREPDFWIIDRHDLKEIAELSPYDCDPELLLVWERARFDRRSDTAREKSADRDEFIESLYLRGCGESMEVLQYVWTQIKAHMIDWLVVKRRPVDIGFAILHNSPYRKDWKIVFAMNRLFLGDSRLKQSLFCSLDLLAFNAEKKICDRRIEIEEKPEWFRVSQDVERQLLERLGATKYARNYQKSIERKVATAKRIYAKWITAINQPSALCPKNPDGDGVEFVPDPERRILYFKTLAEREIGVVIFNPFPFFRKHNSQNRFPKKRIRVSKVSPVRQEDEKLRDAGGNV